MRISVTRSGGFAGMRRQWNVQPEEAEEDRWCRLVDACPWDEAAQAAGPNRAAGGQPADRYIYAIEAADRHAVVPESYLTGPWRDLVEKVQKSDSG